MGSRSSSVYVIQVLFTLLREGVKTTLFEFQFSINGRNNVRQFMIILILANVSGPRTIFLKNPLFGGIIHPLPEEVPGFNLGL